MENVFIIFLGDFSTSPCQYIEEKEELKGGRVEGVVSKLTVVIPLYI